jgi:hypothetical protein
MWPHTVTVLTPPAPTEDDFGNPVIDWDDASETVEDLWSVQPLEGDEVTLNRETVVSRWTARRRGTSALTATSRAVYAGDTYEVDGEVQRWDFEPLAHVVALLKRSESS